MNRFKFLTSKCICQFVGPDLKVEVIFRKEGTTENDGIDFEIGDIGTSAHCYWRLKKIVFKGLFDPLIF